MKLQSGYLLSSMNKTVPPWPFELRKIRPSNYTHVPFNPTRGFSPWGTYSIDPDDNSANFELYVVDVSADTLFKIYNKENVVCLFLEFFLYNFLKLLKNSFANLIFDRNLKVSLGKLISH